MAVADVRIVVLCLALAWYLWIRQSARRDQKPLPPGPKGVPFFGNALQFPRNRPPYLYFDELAKQHGDIVALNMAGKKMIILSSSDAIREVLQTHGSASGARNRPYTVNTFFQHKVLTFLDDDEPSWRLGRKVINQMMLDVKRGECDGLLEREARETALALLDQPDDWQAGMARYVASTICSVALGFSVTSLSDPKIAAIIELAHKMVRLATPTNFLVNTFPVLARLPLPERFCEWRALGDSVRETRERLTKQYCADARAIAATTGVENWLVRMERSKEAQELTSCGAMNAENMAMLLYAAGAESTAGTLHIFTLAAALYPEQIKVVRDQIDQVCGSETPPTFQNAKSLPLVTALLQEVLRWRPPGPMGIPHLAKSDIVLEKRGAVIPKGSMLLTNIWTAEHDFQHYPRAESFDIVANQFDEKGGLRGDGTVWGVGKRICAGQTFAVKELWIMMAYLVWAFDVQLSEDKPRPSPDDFTADIVIRPKPFDARWLPRTAQHVKALRSSR